MRKSTQRNSRIPLASGGFIARGDSGQYEAYRPARHVKPEKQGFIAKIVTLFKRTFGGVDPDKTTEQGSSAAASPSTYGMSLLAQRYERREMISDCREMITDDPRARRATQKFAREAARGGFSITISDDANKGLSAASLTKARASALRLQDICNPKVVSWGWMQIVEGDLFVQAIVFGDNVVNAKRMPAVSMERLTDDTDEVIDPKEAFAQIDIFTQQTTATFPEALMCHERWSHIDGERYGAPEIIAGRRLRRLLELTEEAQAVRRFTRATSRTHFKIGAEGAPGTEDDIKAFREENGFVAGNREVFDPAEIASDVFSNNYVEMVNQPADTGVSDVADIEYTQNVYTTAALPTPPSLYGLGAKDINRDVLEDMRAEYLQETKELTASLKRVIKWLFDLDLLLKGILPETVQYEVHFTESSIEKVTDRVTRIIDLRKNASADFQPDPLITRRKAVQLLADDLDIDDVEAFLKELEKEKQDDFKASLKKQSETADQQAQQQQAQMAAGMQPGAEPPVPGQSSAGGGKPSQGQAQGQGDSRSFMRQQETDREKLLHRQ